MSLHYKRTVDKFLEVDSKNHNISVWWSNDNGRRSRCHWNMLGMKEHSCVSFFSLAGLLSYKQRCIASPTTWTLWHILPWHMNMHVFSKGIAYFPSMSHDHSLNRNARNSCLFEEVGPVWRCSLCRALLIFTRFSGVVVLRSLSVFWTFQCSCL